MPRDHKKQKDNEHGSSSKKPSTEPAANNQDQYVLAHQLYADGVPVSDIAKVLGNEQGPMDICQLEQMIKEVERLSVTQSSEQGQSPPKVADRELRPEKLAQKAGRDRLNFRLTTYWPFKKPTGKP